MSSCCYRGRLAPSPTGWLHVGHAKTFWYALERARQENGTLILRIEDLDSSRCRPEFVSGLSEDLRWLGFEWQEGPDIGGPFGPYVQSQRHSIYLELFQELRRQGMVYPCSCSRRDVLRALQAPHGEEEPVYPGTCRPGKARTKGASGDRINWRFQVPDGQQVRFRDRRCGEQVFTAGKDFGDFLVWRHDNTPSYQLAVVADDAQMKITEVVRGEDLLMSTARQLLLYQALRLTPPEFYHCPLVTDSAGVRLAKRHDALSLRQLRDSGSSPAQIIQSWNSAAASSAVSRHKG